MEEQIKAHLLYATVHENRISTDIAYFSLIVECYGKIAEIFGVSESLNHVHFPPAFLRYFRRIKPFRYLPIRLFPVVEKSVGVPPDHYIDILHLSGDPFIRFEAGMADGDQYINTLVLQLLRLSSYALHLVQEDHVVRSRDYPRVRGQITDYTDLYPVHGQYRAVQQLGGGQVRLFAQI